MSFFLPAAGSAHAAAIDRVLFLAHGLVATVFLIGLTVFVLALLRFRSSRPRAGAAGEVPRALPLAFEVLILGAESVLLLGFSIPLFVGLAEGPTAGSGRTTAPAPGSVVEVRVIARQYAWYIHYPGADGRFGQALPELVDESSNPLGLVPGDPSAEDDITTLNQLHLPVDREAMIRLTSQDVIHGFSLPQMRVQRDAIPGLEAVVRFTPSVTTEAMRQELDDAAFVYEIGCAQLCGLGHYRMRGFLTVHDEESYASWLAEQSELAAEADDFWN